MPFVTYLRRVLSTPPDAWGKLWRMSPVSRGRKGSRKKTPSRQRPLSIVPDTPEACDCPVCTGGVEPTELVNQLVADLGNLVEAEDPLEAELAGGTLAAIGLSGGEDSEAALIEGLIPQIEARANDAALGILIAVGSVMPDPVGGAASMAAARLVSTGLAEPGWAAELAAPVTVADCQRVADADGLAAVLACSFERAGRRHAFIVSVDEQRCGAADSILLFDAEDLPEVLESLRENARATGLEFLTEALDPADFRWHVEKALDARAVHDEEDPPDLADGSPEEDDEGPPYSVVAVLLRKRMDSLPISTLPMPAHGADEVEHFVSTLAPPVVEAKPPAKRKKSAGPAPVYQIKVGLRGATPPIWRRIEVPADISLARLHKVIQIAFGWTDSHLHVFETPYGDFGFADAELGHRAEAPMTLEQVAPAAKSKLTYRYDFGDDWEHEILVEKVLDRDDTATYPRCTGGRRAAPPDDCGGVWGYDELVEILSDTGHPEHKDRLAWLGLDDAADFDPAAFDAGVVTSTLAAIR